ncbi:dihydroxyacetone kinase phosphoryl donor subunit DhaM [Gryllotalpicola protaetiae]|uniref:Phosphocarrier protein HPr n=1 Tax=Gryllotalpicola protaetiae TaxID=2419771 RepID=A0A387BL27_9MICO|nr:dihydroxyacetone kinase phosphoryl donor subunit DhaM [Gryllotalpicola protaetiae]AYG03042.1 HPr family phosphocarrier protein [Gryllotalpicola protaetiae]
MIGIVVVSHSAALAAAALELAQQMVPRDDVRVAVAAGTPDGGLGTDAARVAAAIDEVASPDGVLVFVDLGSAVMSAELGLELRESVAPVRVTSAPLVEGLVAALVTAAAGAPLETVAREARGSLAAKEEHLGDTPVGRRRPNAEQAVPARIDARLETTPATARTLTLVNPAGLHARPAATLAAELASFDATVRLTNRRTGATVPDASSMSALLTLGARQGDELEASAAGADAATALARLESLVADGFGEAPMVEERGGTARLETVRKDIDYGLAISPGAAVGPVVRMPEPILEPPADATLPESERASAAASLAPAFTEVRAGLTRRAERLTDERFRDARAVLTATAALADDPALATEAAELVTRLGAPPARAVWLVLGALAELLATQGGPMAERAADVRDLRARVIARLQGELEPGLPDRTEPFVLVVDELAPADAALLGTTPCVALVTRSGAPTSHTAILARSIGLPAVVWPSARELRDGDIVLVDGVRGEVVVDPSQERVAQASARPDLVPFDGVGRTADGRRVELLANVSGGDDAAAASRAEGVGLFRTEFAFLDRHDAPSAADQTVAYREVFAAFRGRRVVVRTLDAGSDKPLAFLAGPREQNPALGVRGYRTAHAHPDVLDAQLAAIAAAARAERADAWVMAPMIATAAEARQFVARCRPHGFASVGVMIETPAAALCAAEILAEVDFVSLGTNDLAQYATAADRQLAPLADLTDAWQPAVLRLIRLVGEAGAAAGKPVSLCGEAGGDPALAPVLVGLGVTSLSMAPQALDEVAASLGAVAFEQCVAAAAAAAAAPGPREARAAAASVLAK